jgi:hypothetical protein
MSILCSLVQVRALKQYAQTTSSMLWQPDISASSVKDYRVLLR